jgi:hypothetical protein
MGGKALLGRFSGAGTWRLASPSCSQEISYQSIRWIKTGRSPPQFYENERSTMIIFNNGFC